VSKRGHIPIRMCVGCRKRRKKDEMVRWTRSPEGVMVKGGRQAQGRGFHLCPDLGCLKVAQKKMAAFRAFESFDHLHTVSLGGMKNGCKTLNERI